MAGRIGIGWIDEDRFERSKRVRWLDLQSVFESRVLMIGAGALGNEVAKNLALSGFRKITVVDMDHVVGSNLNRCLFFTPEDARRKESKAEAICRGIKRLSDEAEPEAVNSSIEDCNESIFSSSDIVFGCLDNINARLHANANAYNAGRAYIDGGMDGFLGKVMISLPPDGACLQCGMNRSHSKVAELRFSCTGKEVVFHERRVAGEVTTTSVVSAIMVRESLKLVSGRRDLLISNTVFYDGQRNVCEEMEVELNPECPVHVRR